MKKSKEKNMFSWLYSFTKHVRGLMYVGIFCALVSAVSEIFSVYALQNFINNIFSEDSNIYLPLIISAVILLIIGGFAKYYMVKNSKVFAAGSITMLKNKLVNHIEESFIKDVESKSTGIRVSEFTNNMTAIEKFYSELINKYLYTPLMVLIVCIYLSFINWKLLIISISVMPISIWLTKKISNPMEKYAGQYYGLLGEANNLVKENIDGAEIIKSFTLQKLFYKRYEKVMNSVFKENMKMARQESFMMPFVIISYELPYVICAVVGGYFAIYTGSMHVGDIVAFLQLLTFLVNPMSELSNIIGDLMKVKGTAKEIKLSMETEIEGNDNVINAAGEIVCELRNVSFEYAKDKKILDDFSLAVKKNSKVALVGKSGSGKSTVLNLLSGFYFPNSGTISILNQEVTSSNINSIRKCISRVDQDTFLFNDTIRQNIIYGKTDADARELKSIVKKAQLDKFIEELPEKMDTILCENGKNVSGGQRQRIAIARALIKNAPILILDEPTASLDSNTQHFVEQAIAELTKGVTTITVAHRLSTIKDYDEIIVIDNGKIIERGTHNILMEMNGFYKELYDESE